MGSCPPATSVLRRDLEIERAVANLGDKLPEYAMEDVVFSDVAPWPSPGIAADDLFLVDEAHARLNLAAPPSMESR